MSIILKDGTVLPDFPTAYTNMDEEAPALSDLTYRAVFAEYTGQRFDNYRLVCSEKPFAYIKDQNSFITFEANAIDTSSFEVKCADFMFWGEPGEDCSDEDSWGTWEDDVWDDTILVFLSDSWNTDNKKLVWADHDVYEISTFSFRSGATWLNEIYFHRSTPNPKPTILLPNGITLLEFPAGFITEEHPYAVVFSEMDETFNGGLMFYSAAQPMMYVPSDTGTPMVFSFGGEKAIEAYATLWDGVEWDSEEWEFYDHSGPFMKGIAPGDCSVAWSNHDIYVAEDPNGDNNIDDLITTDELYFPAAVDGPVILPNGLRLPAPPVIAGHPYLSLSQWEEQGMPIAMFTPKPMEFVSKGLSGFATDWLLFEGGNETDDHIMYGYVDSTWQNNVIIWGTGFPVGKFSGSMTLTPVWFNHDVFTADSFTESDYSIQRGTKLYFADSIRRSAFRLPNGTWVHDFPDGCFDNGTPYAVIVEQSGVGYLLALMQGPGFTSDMEGTSDPKFCIPRGSFEIWSCTSVEEWTLFSEDTSDKTSVMDTITDRPIVWSNHDICAATTRYADETHDVGLDLVYKSDVNYRITDGWMKSIANEARRLGDVSGSMKPSVVESTLRAATPGTDFSEATLDSGEKMLSGVKAYGVDGTLYEGSITSRGVSDITFSNGSVNVPKGHYKNGCEIQIPTVQVATPTISVSNDGTVVATVNQQTGYVSGGETTASYMLSDVDNVESLRENIKSGSTVFGIEGTYSGNAVSAVTEEIETSMFGEGTNIYDRTITVSENIGQLCGFNLVFNADGTDIGMMSYDANNENCVQIVYVADSSSCVHETASASFSENTITIRLGSTWRTTSLWSNIYFEQGSVTYIPA